MPSSGFWQIKRCEIKHDKYDSAVYSKRGNLTKESVTGKRFDLWVQLSFHEYHHEGNHMLL